MKKSYVLEKIIENKKKNIANFHIGMIIKKKRLEKKMTLDETTKGICCVSYLSKLEHGIIEPKRYVMEEVLERLDVKATALRSTTEYDRLLQDCIKALKDENITKINEIYDSLSEDDDIHFADILRAAYFISCRRNDDAIRLIEKTLSVKEHLDNQEIITLILLISIYNYEEREYAESLDCCLLLDDYYIADLSTNLLCLKLIIENKYILGEYSTMADYVANYQMCCTKTGDNKGILRSYYLYSMAIASDGQRLEAYKIYDNMKESLDESIQMSWKKDLLIILNNPKEVLKYKLTKLEELWAYDCLCNKEKIMAILDDINEEECNLIEKIFVEMIRRKYSEKEYYFVSYLKKTAFAFTTEHGMYLASKYFGNMLIEELTKNSRYKEATQVYEKIREIHCLRWKI